MAIGSLRKRTPLAILALAVAVLGARGAELADMTSGNPAATRARLARDFDPATARPPWHRRCPIAIAAYEDGSASIYCRGRRRSFARVDAESGRIRIGRPWRR